MQNIQANIEHIQERMQTAAMRSGRNPDDVALMAVSKFHTVEEICIAAECGITLFGENRVQEAVEKFPSVFERFDHVSLHMIGSLQRNKVKTILPLVSCIQSIDRLDVLKQIIRDVQNVPTKITPVSLLFELQTGEATKSGFASTDDICYAIEYLLSQQCASISPAGFMTMAPFTQNTNDIRASFKTLMQTAHTVRSRFNMPMPVISMGMSNDFEIAIEEGATLVRIGTSIFGERQ